MTKRNVEKDHRNRGQGGHGVRHAGDWNFEDVASNSDNVQSLRRSVRPYLLPPLRGFADVDQFGMVNFSLLAREPAVREKCG